MRQFKADFVFSLHLIPLMKPITEMRAYKTHYFVKHYQRHMLVDLMKLYQILYGLINIV